MYIVKSILASYTKDSFQRKLIDPTRHAHLKDPCLATGCAKLIFTLCKIAVILAVSILQKRVIRLWNGNFVGFLGIFSKIMKNVPMKRYFHFSGKWQNRPTRI